MAAWSIQLNARQDPSRLVFNNSSAVSPIRRPRRSGDRRRMAAVAWRDLGVYRSPWLISRCGHTFCGRTVSRCFYVLWQLRQVHRQTSYIPSTALVVALVHSRLDYCNSVKVGFPAYLTRGLYSLSLNMAARLIFHQSIPDARIALAMCSYLHWQLFSEHKITVLHLPTKLFMGMHLATWGRFRRVSDVSDWSTKSSLHQPTSSHCTP